MYETAESIKILVYACEDDHVSVNIYTLYYLYMYYTIAIEYAQYVIHNNEVLCSVIYYYSILIQSLKGV